MHRQIPPARFRACSLIFLVVAACLLATAPAALATQVIVDVNVGVDPGAVAKKHGVSMIQEYSEVANGFTADVTAKQLDALEGDKNVQEVAADGIIGRIDHSGFELSGRHNPGEPPATIAPQFAQVVTAAMRRIGVPLSSTADVDGIDDQRVDADIAILDGGVDPYHPDLNVVGGFDCVRGPKAERGYYDRDGHGTLVAGFAAAIDNGIGIVGSAPGARIWAVRVADPSGFVTDAALLCGLEYVAHNKKIDVANLSLSGEDNEVGPCVDPKRWWRITAGTKRRMDKAHQRICQLTEKKGVTVVVAAGNYAVDASTFTPAAYDEVITVSGFADYDGLPGGLAPTPPQCVQTEHDDQFASFSNFGAPIDISAPAVCVSSTFPGGLYARVEGTSFSSPMTAGAAALILANDPNTGPTTVRARLLQLAEPGPIVGDPDAYAEGVLNVSTL